MEGQGDRKSRWWPGEGWQVRWRQQGQELECRESGTGRAGVEGDGMVGSPDMLWHAGTAWSGVLPVSV
jgi:hypothetical protein